jgi:hypothetical protein
LPDWKQGAIQRLGFGLLNKVALLFPVVFWEKTTDFFGHTNKGSLGMYKNATMNPVQLDDEERGEFYIYWNLFPATSRPVLVGILAGKSAWLPETNQDDRYFVEKAMKKLRMVNFFIFFYFFLNRCLDLIFLILLDILFHVGLQTSMKKMSIFF